MNITAVYTAKQTKKILNKIDKKTKVILSQYLQEEWLIKEKIQFLNLKKSLKLSKKFKNVEILWASTREAYNFIQAKQINCHIITVPPKIIEKIEKFGKSFSQLTIDTVKGFLIDSKKSKFKI